MIRFTLLVTDGPLNSSSAHHARAFAVSALAAGHEVKGVFFYSGATQTGNALISPVAAEPNQHQLWQAFQQDTAIPLYLCVSAALRRGVVAQEDAEELNLPQANIGSHFQSVGLGELVALMRDSDRMLQF